VRTLVRCVAQVVQGRRYRGGWRKAVRYIKLDAVLSLDQLVSAFPSLADAPRERPALEAWFDGGGLSEQATHAAAFVLEQLGAPDVEFAEGEALYVWDVDHRAAYREVLARLRA
jgi:hypothetical protein